VLLALVVQPAVAWGARQGLGPAIARFRALDSRLFAPDRAARTGGRILQPALRPVHFDHAEGTAHLHTALAGGRARMEVDLFAETFDALYVSSPYFEVQYGLPSFLAEHSRRLASVAGSSGAAVVVAEAQPQTDLLLRALPYGISVYALFQSPRAPERLHLGAGMECAPDGFELFRRPTPAFFSWERELTNDNEEAECEPYSHAPVAARRAPGPSQTGRAYASERAMLHTAAAHARRDRAEAMLLLRPYTAHDAAGRPVPTEMAWREVGEGVGPVIRVHLVAGRYRFPVLMRFDLVVTG